MSKCMGVTAPSPLTHSRGGCASATPSARQKGGTDRASLSVGGRSAWNEGGAGSGARGTGAEEKRRATMQHGNRGSRYPLRCPTECTCR